MFGDEEEGGAPVRTPDQYNYSTLVGGDDDSAMYDQRGMNCCEMLCGRPSVNEPKCSVLCCRVSKRVLKNMVMFAIVLVAYVLFLSLIMGNRSKSPEAGN